MAFLSKLNLAKRVDDSSPALFDAKLGSTVDDLVRNFNALLAKLDADTGVNATNHVATLSVKLFSER